MIKLYLNSISEYFICEEEGVEEVNGKEPEVCESLQQPLRCCIAYLRHLAVVEGAAEPDVHLVLEQGGVALHKLRHSGGSSVGHGVVVQVVEVDIVHALEK